MTDDFVVQSEGDHTLVRIDPATNEVVASLELDFDPGTMSLGPDVVWLANRTDDAVVRIDVPAGT